ncbi:MAG TPA: D-alanyl-D-alanine carboxypeptidase family protein [Fimbriimonadales bacterium]|nr:D-alanyl-D-alanine carboxypeptidase family protein [Fimbriimonadales bacterium]
MRACFSFAAFLALTLMLGQGPLVGAKSAVIIDADTGQILFEKDAKATRFPASTTKIMTALLLIENRKPGYMLTAPADTQKVPESALGLKPGEQITREDALYALLLKSANDVAHMVAVDIGGSDEKFGEIMNRRAAAIGCVNTHFHNPHGLNDDEHTTCAYDLALIAREALQNPDFIRVTKTRTWAVMRGFGMPDTLVTTTNHLLDNVPGVEGVKTGYTRPAGHCFVGARTLDGWRVISVVMNSPDWVAESKTLLMWPFANLQRIEPTAKGTFVGNAPVKGGASSTTPGVMADNFAIIVRRGENAEAPRIDWNEPSAPVQKGDVVGYMRGTAFDGTQMQVAILAGEDVPVAAKWPLFVGIGAVGGVFLRQRIRPRSRAKR